MGDQEDRHREYRFDNGYGASIINDGYGGESGLFEVAVLDGETGKIIDSPITEGTGDRVIGWLSAEEVGRFLEDVAALPPIARRNT